MAKPTMATIDYTEGGDYIGVDDTDAGAIAKLEADCDLLNDYAEEALHVDGTAGRILRQLAVTIDDATDANEISAELNSIWNGDSSAAVDNIGKNETVGIFSLSSSGGSLTISSTGITGNCVAVLSIITSANTTTTDLFVDGSSSGNGILLRFYDSSDGTAFDLTSGVDTGAVVIYVTYITSS